MRGRSLRARGPTAISTAPLPYAVRKKLRKAGEDVGVSMGVVAARILEELVDEYDLILAQRARREADDRLRAEGRRLEEVTP
jgi:hypothetical protein